MPMYEYKCASCDNQFELRQKFSDQPATECPKCGGPVAKLVSSTAFALKGGGWYNENYSNGAKQSEAPAPAPAPAPACAAATGGGCAGCPSAAA